MKLAATLLLTSVIIGAGCGDPTGADSTPASVTVNASAVSVPAGGTLQLSAVVKNAAGEVIDAPVTFTSSQASIATIDDNGLLTSIGPVGVTFVSAAAGSVSSPAKTITVVAGAPASMSATAPLAERSRLDRATLFQ